MEDINKVRPYIEQLDRQLQNLKPLLEKLNAKSLDEQLLLLNDERQRLDLTNRYAYLLSSLMFAYLKVLNCKDLSPVMEELARVKRYMDSAKRLDLIGEHKEEDKKDKQNHAKQTMIRALTPSISQANFQGKHIKFEQDDKKCSDDNDDNEKPRRNDLPGRTKGTSKNHQDSSTRRLEKSSTKSRKQKKVSKPSKSRGKSARKN